MVKNPRGFGSVYKMKDSRRRKPWRAVAPSSRDIITGKSKRLSLGTFVTKIEAMEALVKYNKSQYYLGEKK